MKSLKTKIIMSSLLAMCSFTTSLADSGYVFKGKIGKLSSKELFYVKFIF